MDRLVRARVLLAEADALGLSVDDLAQAADLTSTSISSLGAGERVPSVAAYVETVLEGFTPGTRRTYRPYLRLAVARFGDRRLDAVGVDDCAALVAEAGRLARSRPLRPNSDGRSSQENCVGALRALFSRAEKAGLVLSNPAKGVDKPRRLPNRRRALTDDELGEVIEAVRATSRDPDLDLLIVRFHLESGARQEGALGITLDDLDGRRSTVWLREKFGIEREQPITPSLLAGLEAHARSRKAVAGPDRVLRTVRGKPISGRRYDTLFAHVQAALPWTNRTPVTAHVLRHTAGTAIERSAGKAVAEAFLGHKPSSVTGNYTKAHLGEVAAALAVLTGEPHPSAETDGRGWHAH